VIITGIMKLRIFGIRIGVLNIVHDWSGIIFSVLAIIHIILHWRWFVAMTKRMIKTNETK